MGQSSQPRVDASSLDPWRRPGFDRGTGIKEPEDFPLIIFPQRRLGNKWTKIARELRGRSENDVKNHWHSLAFKKKFPFLANKRKHEELDESSPDLVVFDLRCDTSTRYCLIMYFQTVNLVEQLRVLFLPRKILFLREKRKKRIRYLLNPNWDTLVLRITSSGRDLWHLPRQIQSWTSTDSLVHHSISLLFLRLVKLAKISLTTLRSGISFLLFQTRRTLQIEMNFHVMI